MDIGKSVVIRGELSANEDLTIEGHVDGRIELKSNVLTIGPNGKIRAEVLARVVIVFGEVTGDIFASDKVDIRDNGSVDGDITSPRVAITDGAHFRGNVDFYAADRRPAPSRMAVEIHLPDADPTRDHSRLEHLQYSVGRFLETFGFEPDPQHASTLLHASWHWQEWFTRSKPTLQAEAQEVYDGIKEALRRQQIDASGAVAFRDRATAAAELIRSLEGFPNAVARLGDVVIVKAEIKGQPRIAIETVSPRLARELEANPLLIRDPEAFFAVLDGQGNREPALTRDR